TLTDGRLVVREIRTVGGAEERDVLRILSAFASHMAENGTIRALKDYLETRNDTEPDLGVTGSVPFSSARKFSMLVSGEGSFVLGAPEYVLRPEEEAERELAGSLAARCRVVALSRSDRTSGTDLPDDRKLAALVLISESLRPNAAETIDYFQREDVTIKVISGDSPVTVSAIAAAAGIKDAEKCVDLSSVPPDADYTLLARENAVFGRVSPMQKKQLIQGLRASGHTVGMTGDGVNDVLALREADVSIAISDGAAAARNVADMIMLNSDYSSLPSVVLEGRNAINNLERSSSLFLVKTIYSILLGILFLFLPVPYPFVPIQITLINGLTVALPSLALSLMRSDDRIRGNFLRNAVQKALPTGLAVVACVLFLTHYGPFAGLSRETVSMYCALSVAAFTVFGVFWVSRPLNRMKTALLVIVASLYASAVMLFGNLFEMKGNWGDAFPSMLFALLIGGFVFSAAALAVHLFRKVRMQAFSGRLAKAATGFFRTLRKHRVGSCSADSAFFMILSSVPLLILLLSLTSFFSVSVDEFMESLARYFPSVVGSMFERIIPDIIGNARTLMTPLSAFIVLWAASRSIYAVVRGLNTIYDLEETRPVYRVRGLSIGYTLIFIVVLLITLILMVFG
ncbi:MAG: HAD-IC family P-type ATPase, partial [Clostridia bacterium]|nr:HAD-IC family P-type ATPase [Clostridia bacterium]